MATGLVASLARPGGNVTGFASLQNLMTVKRFELMRQALPSLSHLDMISGITPFALILMGHVEREAASSGTQVRRLTASSVTELDELLAANFQNPTDAVVAINGPFTNSNKERVLKWAAARRVPVFDDTRDWAVAGALLTYGWSVPEMNERVAATVDKILRGANPAEIPVEQPTRFDLVINARTADTLGITLAPSLLAQASEVIR